MNACFVKEWDVPIKPMSTWPTFLSCLLPGLSARVLCQQAGRTSHPPACTLLDKTELSASKACLYPTYIYSVRLLWHPEEELLFQADYLLQKWDVVIFKQDMSEISHLSEEPDHHVWSDHVSVVLVHLQQDRKRLTWPSQECSSKQVRCFGAQISGIFSPSSTTVCESDSQ